MGLGYLLRYYMMQANINNADIDAKRIKIRATEEATQLTREAQERADNLLHEARMAAEKREDEARITADRLAKKEELLDKRQTDIDRETEELRRKIDEVAILKSRANELVATHSAELAKIAELTREEAREQIIGEVEREYSEDFQKHYHKLEEQGQEKYETRARDILTTVIQRLASSTASELTTTIVSIPNDETKGKIIGKEGRNIKTFERVAGVELIVDDMPNGIIISSFDPVRRHIAKLALENLILDGRIQPAKIEEFIELAKTEINSIIKKKGEEAVYELGIYNFDPRLIAIVGRLHFRTSYGQNVLQHSIEMAHLASMLAQEIGADTYIAKCAALVHDIGKALDHEVEGSHIVIGMKILEKFGADPRVITAMKSHHDDWPHESTEAVIVQVCDIISGSRPGARRDNLENYLKRLHDLEDIALRFPEVQQVYALSAGRELRVFVRPEQTDDFSARALARSIANNIESELRYPGEIKITLIRENRITEFAR